MFAIEFINFVPLIHREDLIILHDPINGDEGEFGKCKTENLQERFYRKMESFRDEKEAIQLEKEVLNLTVSRLSFMQCSEFVSYFTRDTIQFFIARDILLNTQLGFGMSYGCWGTMYERLTEDERNKIYQSLKVVVKGSPARSPMFNDAPAFVSIRQFPPMWGGMNQEATKLPSWAMGQHTSNPSWRDTVFTKNPDNITTEKTENK